MTFPLVILHLGLGSFHRAHQAVYLQDLIDAGDASWTLVAGNTRPDMADTVQALRAQGGAYTLETVTPQGVRRYRHIQSISRVLPYSADLQGLIDCGADANTRIVSFTVTEAGYYFDARGRLDLGASDLAADLAAARAGRPGGTIYAALTAILRERMKRNAGRLTLLNCDNLRHNGERALDGLLQFIELLGDAPLQRWVEANTTSPNAMVDRITPRPTPDVAERVRATTGIEDAVPVMAESFIQWVIEDRFANGRPAWERVGAQLVHSVAPYEEAKIRILNASHSCIAWAGTLVGHQFIHEGTLDAPIHRLAHEYVSRDVIPCLHRPHDTPPGPSPIDLAAYRDLVLERFANPAIRDTNQRVAMDGFSKIPGFITPTIRERLGRGESIAAVMVLPALFLAYLQRWHRGGIAYEYQDQAMDPAEAHALCDAADPLAAFAANRVLFGELAGDARLVAALREASQQVATFIKDHQP